MKRKNWQQAHDKWQAWLQLLSLEGGLTVKVTSYWHSHMAQPCGFCDEYRGCVDDDNEDDCGACHLNGQFCGCGYSTSVFNRLNLFFCGRKVSRTKDPCAWVTRLSRQMLAAIDKHEPKQRRSKNG